jgi:hypothetical protein
VLSEHYIVLDPYDVECIIWIVLFKVHQDFKLYTSLMLKPFLISDQLYCHVLMSLMIEALDGLTEAALA